MRSFSLIVVLVSVSLCATARAEQLTRASDGAPVASAEESATPRVERATRVSVAPLGIGFGIIGIEYEHAQSKLVSAAIGAQLYFPALGALIGTSRLGVGGTLEVRLHPFSDERLTGFWFGPQAQASHGTLYVLGRGYTSTDVALRLMAGYTWVGDSGFSISGGAGLGMATTLTGYGPNAALHLNVGYAF